jgi:hypothetical protein
MTEVRRIRVVERAGPGGLFMLLAYIGAAVFFISRLDGGFWAVILGLLHAVVWPAYAVYHLLVAGAV